MPGPIEVQEEGPSVYSTLMDRALADAKEQVDLIVDEALQRALREVTAGIEDVLQRVYIRGVRDGFHDGVAAECRRTDQQRKAQPDAT